MGQPPALVRWCYTWNNYPEGTKLDWIPEELITTHYCQFETGESGTKHIQGYVEFIVRKRLTWLKKQFDPKIHWANARGTAEQNKAYCTKLDSRDEGTEPFIYGAPVTGLAPEIIEMAGKRMYKEISLAFPQQFLTYNSAIKNAADLLSTKPTNLGELDNHWLYGDSGSGKSHYCRTHWGVTDTYTISAGQKWWSGYLGERTIHIEDIDQTHKGSLEQIKRWADLYPFYIEDKGSGRSIRPLRIVVSSNYAISDIWPDFKEYDPILRRFKQRRFCIEDREAEPDLGV